MLEDVGLTGVSFILDFKSQPIIKLLLEHRQPISI
jgi:hypothetical protein